MTAACRVWVGNGGWVPRLGRALQQLCNQARLTLMEDRWRKLNRASQAMIFRLRTGHIQLNAHLSRIRQNDKTKCRFCGRYSETVVHFLLECRQLGAYRRQFLPEKPTVQGCLYGDIKALNGTVSYGRKLLCANTVASCPPKNLSGSATL